MCAWLCCRQEQEKRRSASMRTVGSMVSVARSLDDPSQEASEPVEGVMFDPAAFGCKSLRSRFSTKNAEILARNQRGFFYREYQSSNPLRSARQSGAWRFYPQKSQKCPPMA